MVIALVSMEGFHSVGTVEVVVTLVAIHPVEVAGIVALVTAEGFRSIRAA